LGLLLGVAVIIGQIRAHTPHAPAPAQVLWSLSANLLMLPSPVTATLFPFDGPAWSLFCELLANIVFAVMICRMRSGLLAGFCAVCGALYFLVLLRVGNGDVGVYWSNAAYGILRVLFGFPVGVLLARIFRNRPRRHSLTSLAPIALLAIALMLSLSSNFDAAYAAIVVFCVTPLVLWFGAGNELPDYLTNIGAFLGDVSYPLYTIQYPLLLAFNFVFVNKLHLPTTEMAVVFTLICILISWLAAHYFDTPVRRRLNRLLRRFSS
jgi:peptidoglycan/LPS O-acetylase OafA/YrhL